MDDSIDSPSSLSVSGAQEDGCGTGNTYIPRDPRLTGRFFTGISNPLTGTALSPRVWHPASSYAGVRPLDVSANQPVYRNPKDDQTSSIQTSTIISMSPASSCLPLPVSVSPSVSPSTDTSFLNDPKISKILDGLAKAKLPSTPSPASPSGSLVGGNIVFQRLVENRNKRSNFLEDARKLNAKISELYSEAQKKKDSADKLTQARDMIMAGVKNLENEELILLNQLQCQPLITSQLIAQDNVSEAPLVNGGQETGGGDGPSGDARPVLTDEEFQPRRLEKRPLEEDSSKTPNKTPVSSIKRLCLHTTSSASKVNSPVRANGSPVKIDRICRREQCLHDKTSKTPSKNDGKSFGVKGSKPVKANPGKKKIEATPSSVMSGITPKTTGSSTPATAPSSTTTSIPVASISSTPLTVQSAAPVQLVSVKQEPQDNYPASSPAATKSQAVEQQDHQPNVSKSDDIPSSTTNNLLNTNKSVSKEHAVDNREQIDEDDDFDFGSGQEAVTSQVNPVPPTQTVSHASGKQSFTDKNREEDDMTYDKENSSFFSPFVSARKVKREYHVQDDFFDNFNDNDVDYGTQDEEEVITGT